MSHTYLEFLGAGFGFALTTLIVCSLITMFVIEAGVEDRRAFFGTLAFLLLGCPLIGWLTFVLGVWK